LNGQVVVNGQEITKSKWVQQVGLQGEYLQYYTDAGSKKVNWNNGNQVNRPLTWYQLAIPTPTIIGDPAYATWTLDLGGMGKGSIWFNGFMVGAYWSVKDSGGKFSQQYYHVPRDYLKPTGQSNNVILIEEIGADPTTISLIQRNQKPQLVKAKARLINPTKW